MNILSKNFLLVTSTALSLVVEPALRVAVAEPDDPKLCLTSPVSGTSVSVSRPIAPYVAELNVQFNQQAGYCLNDYFSSPGGQPLSYDVFLCDQGWNPIPGLFIQYQGLINDDDWIKLTSSPKYLSFVPQSINDLGLYYVQINATDGDSTAFQQFKVSVYQFDDGPDYLSKWLAVGSGLVAAVGSAISAIKPIKEAMDPTESFVRKHPVPAGLIAGTIVGAGVGWIAELINIGTRGSIQSSEEAYNQWWIVFPVAAPFIATGAFLIPFLVKKYPKDPATQPLVN